MIETSRLAYNYALNSGIISRQKMKCFEWFCEFAPCTVNELIEKVGDRYSEAYRFPNHINKTPSFLEKHDLIEMKTTRECNVTGNLSIVWDLTCNDPKPLPKIPSKMIKLERSSLKLSLSKMGKNHKKMFTESFSKKDRDKILDLI